jgi:DNA helicase-2/ATP-dependent DNA helicase PcrA
MFNIDLDQLNPQQQEAVQTVDGPLLVLAGAGSGKTRVITYRVAYLLAQGVKPEHILAVSFTNKAADEMEQRVAELTDGDVASSCHLSTFHSLGANILRRDIDVLGYNKPFTILDTGDQLSVLKDTMKELNLDTDEISPRRVQQIIGQAKMTFQNPEEMPSLRYDRIRPFAQRIFENYQTALKGLNAVDFNDLICLPVEIFRESEPIREKYARKFQYVMVDEYQDTNPTQLGFLEEIVREHQNICAVGDDDQSIYGFRGAVAENILEFEDLFDDTMVVKLEQNYRSTNHILKASNGLIAHNPVRKEKRLWSAKGDGPPLRYIQSEDEREEAEFVAAKIAELTSKTDLEYSDCAILYRINPQSEPFEEALRSFRVPYTVVGATEFFQRREVKDFVAYLRTAMNPSDEISLRRIVNVPPRGIGPTTVERISNFADENNLAFFEALKSIASDPSDVDGIGHAGASHLSDFSEIITTYKRKFDSLDDVDGQAIYSIANQLLDDSRLKAHVRNIAENPKEAAERIENLETVLSSLQRHFAESEEPGRSTLESFLTQLMLRNDDPEGDDDRGNTVGLMTIHSSKGLEFPCVFLVGMEEGYLPHHRNAEDPSDVSEERRLTYVGMTRAQKYLFLTSAVERTRYGQEEVREPSRFIEEIPEETVEQERAASSESLAEKRQEQNEKYLDAMRDAIFDD